MSELKTKLEGLIKDLEVRQRDFEDFEYLANDLRSIASSFENLSSVDDIIEELRELEQGISDELELKPCPFCGKTNSLSILSSQDIDTDNAGSSYAVYCSAVSGFNGCGATSGFGSETKEQAALKWNRRV